MPSITVREYNPDSGALLGNISVLAFGRMAAGTTSRIKVIDVAFTEVNNVGNIKLGLISSGGLTVNTNPDHDYADGSSGNGQFGIETTPTFDATKTASPLTRHFSGLNADITAANANNVDIPSRSSTLSNYIYLDIEVASSATKAINGAWKLFFDFN